MAGEILVEHPFRNIDLATSGVAKPQIFEREIQPERDVFGQLVFAQVFLEIGFFHVPQRGREAFARHQPFVKVVPGVGGQETSGQMTAFEVERALGLPRRMQRKVVGLMVQRRRFALQEQIKFVAGELVAEEILQLRGLLHLPVMAVDLSQHLVAAALGAENLAFDLLDLDRQDLGLMVPIDQPACPTRLRDIEAGILAGDGRGIVDDGRGGDEQAAEFGSSGSQEWLPASAGARRRDNEIGIKVRLADRLHDVRGAVKRYRRVHLVLVLISPLMRPSAHGSGRCSRPGSPD